MPPSKAVCLAYIEQADLKDLGYNIKDITDEQFDEIVFHVQEQIDTQLPDYVKKAVEQTLGKCTIDSIVEPEYFNLREL